MRPAPLALVALIAATAAAQSTWQLHGSDAMVRIVGPRSIALRGPSPKPVELPAGDYAVHFGADAAGKPRSLAFAVREGDFVDVAIDRADAARDDAVADSAAWDTFRGGGGEQMWTARVTGPADRRDVRVAADFAIAPGTTVGLVARWTSATQHYRCVLDAARGELRLERQFGDGSIVLARTTTSARDGDVVELALQIEGFRIAVFRDDELALQAFDGAFDVGSVGSWSGATAGNFVGGSRFTIAGPAAPRASAAVVRHDGLDGLDGHAEFHASTTVSPGGYHALEVLLDRSHPPLPSNEAGVEPWLVFEVAAPRVLMADFRQSLGENVLGEVPGSGVVAATVRWPALRLAGRFGLLRSLFVAADGEAIVGATPLVPLRL